MKIVDASPNVRSFPVEYRGDRIKKDAQGLAEFEHGRPATERVYAATKRTVVSFRFLVERATKEGMVQEWMSEAELANSVGKKKFRNMVRTFLNSDKGQKVLELANG